VTAEILGYLHQIVASTRVDERLHVFVLQLLQGLYRQAACGKTGLAFFKLADTLDCVLCDLAGGKTDPTGEHTYAKRLAHNFEDPRHCFVTALARHVFSRRADDDSPYLYMLEADVRRYKSNMETLVQHNSTRAVPGRIRDNGPHTKIRIPFGRVIAIYMCIYIYIYIYIYIAVCFRVRYVLVLCFSISRCSLQNVAALLAVSESLTRIAGTALTSALRGFRAVCCFLSRSLLLDVCFSRNRARVQERSLFELWQGCVDCHQHSPRFNGRLGLVAWRCSVLIDFDSRHFLYGPMFWCHFAACWQRTHSAKSRCSMVRPVTFTHSLLLTGLLLKTSLSSSNRP